MHFKKNNQYFTLIFDDIGIIFFKIKETKVPWIEIMNKDISKYNQSILSVTIILDYIPHIMEHETFITFF